MKKLISAALIVCAAFSLSIAQNAYQPKVFKIKEKQYFIYPVRATNLSDVPPTGFTLPDGEYVIFKEYEFKAKRLKKKMVLKDTTQVSGYVTIKNNMANGPAELFDRTYYYYDSKNNLRTVKGNYVNGAKEGVWKYYSGKYLEYSF